MLLKANIQKLISISQFATVVVPTGITIDVPTDNFALIMPIDELTKKGIITQVGTLYSYNKNEIAVCITNTTSAPYHLQPQEIIGQLVIVPLYKGVN